MAWITLLSLSLSLSRARTRTRVIRPYQSSLFASSLDGIQCQLKVEECNSFPSRLILGCPCVVVHRKTSLSSFLIAQQLPACLAFLSWIVWEMGGKWPYNFNFEGCCFWDLFQNSTQHLSAVPIKLFFLSVSSALK